MRRSPRARGGSHKYNAKKHVLEWTLPLIDKDSKTANLEFVVAGSNEAGLLPRRHHPTPSAPSTSRPSPRSTPEPARFGLYHNLTTEKYEVVENAE